MPTFSYPTTYAAEAARILRALASASQLTEARAPTIIADLRDATAAMRLGACSTVVEPNLWSMVTGKALASA